MAELNRIDTSFNRDGLIDKSGLQSYLDYLDALPTGVDHVCALEELNVRGLLNKEAQSELLAMSNERFPADLPSEVEE